MLRPAMTSSSHRSGSEQAVQAPQQQELATLPSASSLRQQMVTQLMQMRGLLLLQLLLPRQHLRSRHPQVPTLQTPRHTSQAQAAAVAQVQLRSAAAPLVMWLQLVMQLLLLMQLLMVWLLPTRGVPHLVQQRQQQHPWLLALMPLSHHAPLSQPATQAGPATAAAWLASSHWTVAAAAAAWRRRPAQQPQRRLLLLLCQELQQQAMQGL
jgi:hypothetical protein